MRNSNPSLKKVAMVRDERIPVGTASPLYLKCYCGGRPEIPFPLHKNIDTPIICKGCGTVFDRNGWILSDDVPV